MPISNTVSESQPQTKPPEQEVEYACSCNGGLVGPSAHCEAHGDAFKARQQAKAIELSQQARDLSLVRIMARRVKNQQHFQYILQSAQPQLRHEVYKQLKPMLRFKPIPFWKMKFSDVKHA